MEFSVFVCFDWPEKWHESDKLPTVAVGVSCQVAAECGACWREVGLETRVCIHQYNVTHAKYVSVLQEGVLSACHLHSCFCHRYVVLISLSSVCLFFFRQAKQMSCTSKVTKKKTAVVMAQMTVEWRMWLWPWFSPTPVHPEDSYRNNANTGQQMHCKAHYRGNCFVGKWSNDPEWLFQMSFSGRWQIRPPGLNNSG